jgi:ankyrin repeat protein
MDAVKSLIQEDDGCLRELDEKRMSPLFIAMIFGHYELAVWLITHHLDMPHRDANRNSAIHYSIYLRSPSIVKMLIEAGADLLDADQGHSKNRCVHLAMMTGSVEILDMLLQAGCKVNCPTQYGPNPLWSAALTDRLECFKYALKLDPTMWDSHDGDGFNLLHHSAWYGSTKIMEWLIQEGYGDEESTPAKTSWPNLLSLSVQQGAIESVKWILNRKPEMAQDGLPYSDRAALSGNWELMRTLISYGCPIQRADLCVVHAIENSSIEALEWMLQTLNLDLPTTNGEGDPISFSAVRGDVDDPYVLDFIYQRGARISGIQNLGGVTLLQYACDLGLKEIVKWMFNHGVPLGPRYNGFTLAHIAVKHDKVRFLSWLLRHGAPATTTTSQSLLEIASKEGLNCVPILLKCANIDEK